MSSLLDSFAYFLTVTEAEGVSKKHRRSMIEIGKTNIRLIVVDIYLGSNLVPSTN